MLTYLVFDFARVLFFPSDTHHQGKLRPLHESLAQSPDYNPLDYFYLNQELLDFLKPYHPTHTICVFTAGNTLHLLPPVRAVLNPVFHHYFTEGELGHPKSSPTAFTALADRLHTQPSDIFFTDDKEANIAAAKRAGCTAVQYKSNAQFIPQLRQLLQSS